MKFLLKSSIGRKIIMALSAIFLMIFLLQHFIINIMSVLSPKVFNTLSHFMGTNIIVQFILQPILIFGVCIHFIMGFFLDFQNRGAKFYKYNKIDRNNSSTWMSRNMIWSGLVILSFLILHFIDFWIPEINYKYIEMLPENPTRYYNEMIHKFENPVRVIIYCFSFLLLGFHLSHGFSSSIKSLALAQSYEKQIKFIGNLYSIFIPLGFCLIAIYHYLNY